RTTGHTSPGITPEAVTPALPLLPPGSIRPAEAIGAIEVSPLRSSALGPVRRQKRSRALGVLSALKRSPRAIGLKYRGARKAGSPSRLANLCCYQRNGRSGDTAGCRSNH